MSRCNRTLPSVRRRKGLLMKRTHSEKKSFKYLAYIKLSHLEEEKFFGILFGVEGVGRWIIS